MQPVLSPSSKFPNDGTRQARSRMMDSSAHLGHDVSPSDPAGDRSEPGLSQHSTHVHYGERT
jgi:hypothetical protein